MQQRARVSEGVCFERHALLKKPLHVRMRRVRPNASNADRPAAIDFLEEVGLKNIEKHNDAITEYVDEQNAAHRKALKLDDLVEMAKSEVKPGQAPAE